jgi:methyl coenzyme M reductase alpha subunit
VTLKKAALATLGAMVGKLVYEKTLRPMLLQDHALATQQGLVYAAAMGIAAAFAAERFGS